jgi:hypothetical protein
MVYIPPVPKNNPCRWDVKQSRKTQPKGQLKVLGAIPTKAGDRSVSTSTIVPKPLLTPDRLDRMHQELQRSWNYKKKYVEFPRDMSTFWSIESYVLPLGSEHWDLGKHSLKQLCNKPTCFYWKRSVLDRGLYCHRLVLVGIYKEWFRCHDDEPNMDYDYFFANPLRIISGRPTTFAGIAKAH